LKRQGVDLFKGREKQKGHIYKVPNEYSRGNSCSHKNVRELMFPYEYILMDGNIYMSLYIYTQGKKVAKHPCIQYPLDKKKGWSALCMYTHLGIDINSLLNLIAISLEYLVANKICHPLNWDS